jgi:hypothetical protein
MTPRERAIEKIKALPEDEYMRIEVMIDGVRYVADDAESYEKYGAMMIAELKAELRRRRGKMEQNKRRRF